MVELLFNTTTSGDDDDVYQQRQEIIHQTPKKGILVAQKDWNAKIGKDARADWGDVCGPYCSSWCFLGRVLSIRLQAIYVDHSQNP